MAETALRNRPVSVVLFLFLLPLSLAGCSREEPISPERSWLVGNRRLSLAAEWREAGRDRTDWFASQSNLAVFTRQTRERAGVLLEIRTSTEAAGCLEGIRPNGKVSVRAVEPRAEKLHERCQVVGQKTHFFADDDEHPYAGTRLEMFVVSTTPGDEPWCVIGLYSTDERHIDREIEHAFFSGANALCGKVMAK